jgi:hypothetical protein
MPIDLKPEKRFANIPVGALLKVAVVTTSTNFNATARIDDPNGGVQDVAHGAIVNNTHQVRLTKTGRYQVRVTAVATAATPQTGTATVTIDSPPGTQIRQFSTTFSGQMNGQDPFVGRAKVLVSVV